MKPVGEIERLGILKRVVPYAIHDDLNYRLIYAWLDDPGGHFQANIPAEATYPSPEPGDKVKIKMLMDIVISVEKA